MPVCRIVERPWHLTMRLPMPSVHSAIRAERNVFSPVSLTRLALESAGTHIGLKGERQRVPQGACTRKGPGEICFTAAPGLKLPGSVVWAKTR